MVEEVEEEEEETSVSIWYSFDHTVVYVHRIFLRNFSNILVYNETAHWAIFNFGSMEYFDWKVPIPLLGLLSKCLVDKETTMY